MARHSLDALVRDAMWTTRSRARQETGLLVHYSPFQITLVYRRWRPKSAQSHTRTTTDKRSVTPSSHVLQLVH